MNVVFKKKAVLCAGGVLGSHFFKYNNNLFSRNVFGLLIILLKPFFGHEKIITYEQSKGCKIKLVYFEVENHSLVIIACPPPPDLFHSLYLLSG